MRILILFIAIVTLFSCKQETKDSTADTSTAKQIIDAEVTDTLLKPQEKHLKNLRQLTFGGDNAEAYWSFDDKQLVFQARNEAWGTKCDQIYIMDATQDFKDGSKPTMVSTGRGRTTCSYFMPGDKSVIYASTHEGDANCPPEPERRADGKYVWPIYSDFDIYTADLEGNILKKLTD